MADITYVWDPIEDNVIQEKDENGNVLVDYTTRPTLYGSVLSQDRGGQVRHYHFDGQGNTTELTDENGNVTDTRKYSAFGEVTESTGTTVFPFQWQGSYGFYTDADLDNCQFLSRTYQVEVGRWLDSRRPSVTDTTNQYSLPNTISLFGMTQGGGGASTCDIAVHCWNVVRGGITFGRHCGFTLHINPGNIRIYVDGGPTMGVPRCLSGAAGGPKAPGYSESQKVRFPMSACVCLSAYLTKGPFSIGPPCTVEYERSCKNSNWWMHCAASACNVDPNFTVDTAPPGYNCMVCDRWMYVPPPHGGSPGITCCVHKSPAECPGPFVPPAVTPTTIQEMLSVGRPF